MNGRRTGVEGGCSGLRGRGFPGPEALVLGREEVLASKWGITGRLAAAGHKPHLSA